MSLLLYCDLPILCLALNIFIFVKLSISDSGSPEILLLRRTMLFAIIFIVIDSMLSMCELGLMAVPYMFIYCINIAYNILACGLSFSWLMYCNCIFSMAEKGTPIPGRSIIKALTYVWHIAAAIALILMIIMKDTDLWMCETDGGFQYGSLDTIWYVIEVVPLFYTMIFAFVCCMLKSHYAYHDRYVPIIVFGACIGIFYVILLSVSVSLPLVCMGVTMGFVYMGIANVEKEISRDGLTGLDNRRQMIKDVDNLIHRAEKNMFMIMMDMDGLKRINDGFGHSEGDQALKNTARTIMISCRGESAKAYRFGGDEFVVVKRVKEGTPEEQEAEVTAFIDKINNGLAEYNADSSKLYRLSVSIGYAEFYADKKDTIPQIIDRADKMMYREKNSNKLGS